jgi:hypothetical protein
VGAARGRAQRGAGQAERGGGDKLGTHSLGQIEQQIGSLTSSGAAAQAFKRLVLYVTTKCS